MRPTQHYPLDIQSWPRTLEQPAEFYIRCACGDWEFSSQESAGGPCDTAWQADFEAHLNEEAFD